MKIVQYWKDLSRKMRGIKQQELPETQSGFYSVRQKKQGFDRFREVITSKTAVVSGFSAILLIGVVFFAPIPGTDSSDIKGRAGGTSSPRTVAGIISEALGLSGPKQESSPQGASGAENGQPSKQTQPEPDISKAPDSFDKTEYADEYIPPVVDTPTNPEPTQPSSSGTTSPTNSSGGSTSSGSGSTGSTSSGSGTSSGGGTTSTRPQPQKPEPIVDINYLHGYSYLRGVNAFTLFRQHRSSLSYDKLGEPQESYNFLAKKGHKLIRLGISWGRLQPNLNGSLDQNYLAAIDREVAKISKAGMYVVLDLHNGGSHPNDTGDNAGLSKAKKLGAGITEAQLVRTWNMISDKYRSDMRIIAYELFNEPWANDSTNVHAVIQPEIYRRYTNSVVNNLRLKNDTHWIWIGGMVFSGNDNLSLTSGGDGKRSGSAWIKDPIKRTMYTQHFYAPTTGEWGKDYTAEYLASSDASVENTLGKLRDFAEWCKSNGVRCSIGELGWPGRDNTQKTECYHAQPTSQSAYKWNINFGERVYQIANSYKLDVTYFAAMSLTYPCEWRHIVAYAGPVYFDGKYFLTSTAINHGRSHNTILEAAAYRSK